MPSLLYYLKLIKLEKEKVYFMDTQSKQLDKQYLIDCYQDMADEIGEIFELFLLETAPSIKKIKNLIDYSQLQQAGEELHKIAPSFSSIGLPQLTIQLREMEAVTKVNDQAKALSLIITFDEEFKAYLPAVNAEYERLTRLKACA
jgi:HPt (histidine-containing phosphotransfer) domain-containing protein